LIELIWRGTPMPVPIPKLFSTHRFEGHADAPNWADSIAVNLKGSLRTAYLLQKSAEVCS